MAGISRGVRALIEMATKKGGLSDRRINTDVDTKPLRQNENYDRILNITPEEWEAAGNVPMLDGLPFGESVEEFLDLISEGLPVNEFPEVSKMFENASDLDELKKKLHNAISIVYESPRHADYVMETFWNDAKLKNWKAAKNSMGDEGLVDEATGSSMTPEEYAEMLNEMGVNKGGYMNKGRKIPVKLTKGEIVLPPDVTDRNLAVLERMNEIGLQARAMGGVAAYKAAGGMVRHFQEGGFADWANDNNEAIGQVGNFLYKSAYNDPNAIDAFQPIKREDADDKKDEGSSLKKIIQLASNALRQLPQAIPALQVAQEAMEAKGIRTAAIAGIAAGIDLGGVNDYIENLAKPAVRKAAEAGEISYENEVAYVQMVSDITDLTTVALAAQGSGPKTDFDFEVAARSTANLSSSPQAIKASMERMIANANTALGELGETAIKAPNTVLPESASEVVTRTDDLNNLIAKGTSSAGQNPSNYGGGPEPREERSEPEPEPEPEIVEAPRSLVVAIETANKVPNAGLKAKALRAAYKALVNWLSEKDPNHKIKVFGTEYTIGGLIEEIKALKLMEGVEYGTTGE